MNIKKRINVIFVDTEFIKDLHMRYFDDETPTDVIAFPFDDRNFMGEVYVAIDVVKENAKTFNQRFDTELKRVIIHGILHLFGYSDKGRNRSKMWKKQEEILKWCM